MDPEAACACAAGVETKHQVLLDSLRRYYEDPCSLDTLTRVLRNESNISLRILDWLVTNYAKKHNISYALPSGAAFNMFLSYKSQLKAYSKRFFDPFCRRERLAFTDARGRTIHTTAGQLNFFRWAIKNGVVEFGEVHADAIEADMMQSIRHRYNVGADADGVAPPAVAPAAAAPSKPKPKRKELSRAAIKTCTNTRIKVTVRFE